MSACQLLLYAVNPTLGTHHAPSVKSEARFTVWKTSAELLYRTSTLSEITIAVWVRSFRSEAFDLIHEWQRFFEPSAR